MTLVAASAERDLFLESTRKFLERQSPTSYLRELSERRVGFDRQWWIDGAGLGWLSLAVPEAMGGASLSEHPVLDTVWLTQELGRVVAPGPLSVSMTVLSALSQARNSSRYAAQMEGLLSAEAVATLALYEPGCAWAPSAPRLRAERTSNGYRLTGSKDRVEAGDQADLLLVTAELAGEPAQFLVPAKQAGVRVERMRSLDLTRQFATVAFESVELSAEARVEFERGAAAAIERQCQQLFILQSAETVGVTARVFELTMQWAFDRYSFGRPLASYQAIKHRCAGMRTWLEAMHAITERAAQAFEAGARDSGLLTRAASRLVSARSLEIIQDCVQIHGGIGVTWEHDLHIFLRRAVVNSAMYGTPEEQTRALRDLLGKSEGEA